MHVKSRFGGSGSCGLGNNFRIHSHRKGAEEVLRAGLATQPHSLPEELVVSFTIAESSGGPAVAFTVRELTSAQVPEGQFWTNDGPMSAEAIDRHVACRASERLSPEHV
ncbi:hypothetical protein ACFWOJ_22500 [Streptomyces sp. NPDC058439]|uniref:hypothetical protein n=1 Tax=Streptomyces sp. NPDC058439 TaxID=3346500 RepID=UPI00364669D5